MKFNKEELVQTLKENREEHREIFLDALEGYKKQVIRAFEEKIEKVKEGEKVDLYTRLVQPVDKTHEYDVAIKMFEMTCDPEIELSMTQFRCFVMDDWEWKAQFEEANSSYTAKALRKKSAYDD